MNIMGCVSSSLQERTTCLTMPTKDMFLFKDIIGKGGFGKVISALSIKDRKWYAVKCINKKELLNHSTGLSMITGELNAMKKVNHPFVIGLHFAFHDTFYCYFVLDLKTGKDLRYYLKRNKTFDEDQIAFLMACLCSAMHHIHSCRIIHRDVKVENIVIDARGYPHITDFGVAHVQPLEEIEYPLQCLSNSGTRPYLAPEIFCKSHIHGPEVDYWSLGVIAYELFYGKRPFDKHVPNDYWHYLEAAASVKKQNQMRGQYNDKKTSSSAGTSVNANSFSTSSMMSSYSSSYISSAASSKNSSNASSPIGTPGSPTPCNSAAAAALLDDVPGAFPDIHLMNIHESLGASIDVTCSLLDSCEDNCEEEKDATEMSLFGLDCWTVDAVLPQHLRTKIPVKAEHEEANRRLISENFTSFLQGLLEVRPTYRLGARNIHALKAHPFFSENNVSNWDYLCTKAYVPRLSNVPLHTRASEVTASSKLMDVMCDLDGRIMDEVSSCQVESAITDEQQRNFKSFNYIRPEHFHMFEQKPPVSLLTTKISASTSNLCTTGGATPLPCRSKKVHVTDRQTSAPTTTSKPVVPSQLLPSINVKGAGGSSIVKPRVFF